MLPKLIDYFTFSWLEEVRLELKLGMQTLLCLLNYFKYEPFSGEIHDFLEVSRLFVDHCTFTQTYFQDDLKAWYPELASRIRISLVEALPSVLPMFSKQLIDYTESTFKESKIDILTKTMVKEVSN